MRFISHKVLIIVALSFGMAHGIGPLQIPLGPATEMAVATATREPQGNLLDEITKDFPKKTKAKPESVNADIQCLDIGSAVLRELATPERVEGIPAAEMLRTIVFHAMLQKMASIKSDDVMHPVVMMSIACLSREVALQKDLCAEFLGAFKEPKKMATAAFFYGYYKNPDLDPIKFEATIESSVLAKFSSSKIDVSALVEDFASMDTTLYEGIIKEIAATPVYFPNARARMRITQAFQKEEAALVRVCKCKKDLLEFFYGNVERGGPILWDMVDKLFTVFSQAQSPQSPKPKSLNG